ncbi:ISA1 [Sanghuangporus vaninii]
MISMVRRSSMARLSTAAAPPPYAYTPTHTYSHLAATRGANARSRWSGRPAFLGAGAFSPSGVAFYYVPSSSFAPVGQAPVASTSKMRGGEVLGDRPPMVIPEDPSSSGSTSTSTGRDGAHVLSSDAASPQVAARPPKPPKVEKPKPRLVGRKAALTVTPAAVSRLRALLMGPHPQLIRIGVRNKGCAGMSYHLEYVDKPGPFDEIVEQDGVRVLIDSKALFSIIGSEMDWVEDRLSAKFAFKNPNVKDACGCGESFSIGD